MRKCVFLLVVTNLLITLAFSTEIIIIHTSNLHGTVFPYNYFSDTYEAKGLAVIDYYIKELKRLNEDVLLIDTGNLLYGSPFGDFSQTLNNDPVVEAFNLVGYDVFIPGSFELSTGKKELSRVIQNLKATTLAGNLRNVPGVKSFLVRQLKNGIKVGIIGVAVPYGSYEFDDLVSSVRKAIASAKSQGANFLLIATSGGITTDPLSGRRIALESNLNIGDILVREFSKDVDGFLFGNQSFVYVSQKSNKFYSLAGNDGESVNKITINAEKVGNNWKTRSVKVENLPLTNYTPSEDFLRKFESYEQAFQNWLKEVLFSSSITVGFNKYMAFLEDSLTLEIVNKAIIEYTKSSIGIWNIFNPNYIGIAQGDITRKDIYALIGKTTGVKLIRMTGKDVKDIITKTIQNIHYEDGKVKFDKKLVMYPWLFDIFENITYEVIVNERQVGKITYAGKNLEDNDVVYLSVPSIRTYGKEPILFGKIVKDFEIPVQKIVLSVMEKVLNGKVLNSYEDGNRITSVKLEYVVNAGDTLKRLSYRLGVSEEKLLSENKFIKDKNLLRPGWKLIYYKKYLDLIPPLKEFFDVE
ncbi:MAG: 5'-nucleotidase C-terminal domain-containing protein [Fervidobacterium sp.]|nr:5'-nucleotidase C-terminal domain-containing protein [Fervidobacterium sp.]